MSRLSYSLGFILCAFFWAFAFYLEHGLAEMPCLLCQVQRIFVATMGIIFLIAAVHNPARLGRSVYSFLLFIVGLCGLLLASRQLWLIAHPPADIYSQCSASLSYLIQVLPLEQVIKTVIQGGSDCAKTTWSFLSLTLPGWSFIAFSLLLVVNFVAALGRKQSIHSH
jgi:disulfide bond formation protein DsbB